MHMSFGMPLISAEHDPHFAGLAVPAHREVVGLRRLDLVHGVEHHHAFDDVLLVLDELALARRRRARS